jgi:hypothetical protein
LLASELVGTLTAEPDLVGQSAYGSDDHADRRDGPSRELACMSIHVASSSRRQATTAPQIGASRSGTS